MPRIRKNCWANPAKLYVMFILKHPALTGPSELPCEVGREMLSFLSIILQYFTHLIVMHRDLLCVSSVLTPEQCLQKSRFGESGVFFKNQIGNKGSPDGNTEWHYHYVKTVPQYLTKANIE